MSDSILTSVKKALGLTDDYEAFDPDVIMHINTVFADLNQLGLGPDEGFMIEDKTTTWDAFIGDELRFNSVKTYTFLRVRLMFDPPQTSYLIESLRKQVEELGWRLNVGSEYIASLTPPTP